MHKRFISISMMVLLAFFAVCLGTAQTQKSSARQIAKPVQKPRILSAQESGDILTKTADLYYFDISDLERFSCAVHPDWQAVYKASHNGTASAPDDPIIRLLNSVVIVLNKQVGGDTTVEWNVPTDATKPLDENSFKLLDAQHGQLEFILRSVLSQWEPFVDGETIMDISNGVEITQTEEGYSLRFGEGVGARSTFLDKRLVIQRYAQAGSDGTSVKSLPKFNSTKNGLLVSSFVSYIDRPDAGPGDLQKMQVDVEYRTVDGFHLPSRLKLTDQNFVKGFEINFDGCKVIRKQNEPGGGVKAQREEMRPGQAEADTCFSASL
jgi:hypothetical protein